MKVMPEFDEGIFLPQLGKKQQLLLHRVNVSTLAATIGYCEFQVKFSSEGIQTVKTPAMEQGIKLHKERENQEDPGQFTTVSKQEIVNLLKMGAQIEFKMEGERAILIHNNFYYVGRMDKIPLLTKRKFIIEEFKTQIFKEKPIIYDGYMIQAITYALMVSKKYNVPVTNGSIQFTIQDRNTKETGTLESKKITKQLLAWYYEKLQRFENLYQKKTEPIYHGSTKKCAACNAGYKSICHIGKNIN